MPHNVAQICLNGHVTNDSTSEFPAFNRDHCERCGEKTITACPKCEGLIRGALVGVYSNYQTPAYCDHCGAPFPWTESKAQAAIELFVEESMLNEQDAKQFAESVQEVMKETPSTELAASRIRRFLAKATPEVVETFRAIVASLLTEAVKQKIFGG